MSRGMVHWPTCTGLWTLESGPECAGEGVARARRGERQGVIIRAAPGIMAVSSMDRVGILGHWYQSLHSRLACSCSSKGWKTWSDLSLSQLQRVAAGLSCHRAGCWISDLSLRSLSQRCSRSLSPRRLYASVSSCTLTSSTPSHTRLAPCFSRRCVASRLRTPHLFLSHVHCISVTASSPRVIIAHLAVHPVSRRGPSVVFLA